MFVEVIVDVPAKQTDRPFDYRVPAALVPMVEIGSRVGVPFAGRVLQAFVIGIKSQTEVPANKIKDISEVLDPYPVLTPDLVELSEWMSHKYLCSRISCILAMIPSALKAKYERRLSVRPDVSISELTQSEQEIAAWVQAKKEITLEALLEQFAGSAGAIRRLIETDVLLEERMIKNRMKAKTQRMVFPAEDVELLRETLLHTSKQAARQRELLEYFMANPAPISLSELSAQLRVSTAVVQSLAEKGAVVVKDIEVLRDPYADRHFEPSKPLRLTEEQESVFTQMKKALQERERHSGTPILLHGVTGSGKTEVYLQIIAECLQRGEEAIVLVPEISLTPQMVERFKGRFGDRVAVLHSRLSGGERYDEWRKIRRRQAQVVVGARSAIFAPLEKLSLIIMDEEHESSYKQEETPKYHARDAALERARLQRAIVILGSATPSLESFRASVPLQKWSTDHPEDGQHVLRLELPHRVGNRPLPKVQVVDMRGELQSGNRSMFSRSLHKAIEERIERREQIVLMLNRRGFSTFVMCRSCGYVANCPHCDISLTYHRHTKHIRCHYCGYTERELEKCPSCDSPHIRYFGTGTQRVEEELVKLFPGIRVIRMDVDTTTEKGSHEKWLRKFGQKQADVLLGTQMIAKGLDFPDVTLVGVIAADTVLHLPDFRSAERTFQLLTQVAGRAGRHELPGEVIIQTYAPEHYSIELAKHHDYDSFARKELQLRHLRDYPPYCRLVLFTISHEKVQTALRFSEHLASVLKETLDMTAASQKERGALRYEVLGPVASPIPKLKDRYRFQCMVKYRGTGDVSSALKEALERCEEAAKSFQVQVATDVDPYILM
ncbi:primosomal protein N' [Marinicrinis lubricantis]|uniref:Replication restart protein PriA n=1 Tax=Marinicrinis lubricantis TaxID=2086470 RepID=A0ABW1IMR1_9BACL